MDCFITHTRGIIMSAGYFALSCISSGLQWYFMFLLLVGGGGQASSAHRARMVFTLLAMMVAGKLGIVHCKACSLGSASSRYLFASTLSHLTLACGGGTHFCISAIGRLTCRVAVTGGISFINSDVAVDFLCHTPNKEVYPGSAHTIKVIESWCWYRWYTW